MKLHVLLYLCLRKKSQQFFCILLSRTNEKIKKLIFYYPRVTHFPYYKHWVLVNTDLLRTFDR